VRLSSRRSDDADVIRARLRALLAQDGRPPGWVPDDDDPAEDPFDEPPGIPVADEPERADGLPAGIGRHRSPGPAVRWAPGWRGARSLWAVGLAAALLLLLWTWLDRPRVAPVPELAAASSAPSRSSGPAERPVGEAAETSSTVVVSVVGLVGRPGLVTLPSGSRVADAVEAAGGLLPEADPASVNLAAVVADGQQVAVGVPGAAGSGGGGGGGGTGASGPVNLNTATAADLDALPGVGPVLAGRIVDYRTEHGRFTSVDQLDDVPGIGPAIAARLADLVTV